MYQASFDLFGKFGIENFKMLENTSKKDKLKWKLLTVYH